MGETQKQKIINSIEEVPQFHLSDCEIHNEARTYEEEDGSSCSCGLKDFILDLLIKT